MKKFLKMIFIGLIVAIASQLNLELISNDFRISAGVIFFIIFLSIERDVNPISAGIIALLFILILNYSVNPKHDDVN